MFITLNGEKVELEGSISLIDLLLMKGLDPNRIVIEHNYQVLEKKDWEKTIIKENDNLEILRFVGGG